MAPLLEVFPSFFPPRSIDRDAFIDAVGVVTCQGTRVEGMGDDVVLLPLALREHPGADPSASSASAGRGGASASAVGKPTLVVEDSNVRLEEVEQELMTRGGKTRTRRMVNLVTSSGGALSPGEELILHGTRRNDNLLLECGYIWDSFSAASVPLRMSIDAAGHNAKGHAETRRGLLEEARLNRTEDFTLTHGGLPEKLRLWSRIVLATNDDLTTATSTAGSSDSSSSSASSKGRLAAFGRPMSIPTEDEINANMLNSIGRILNAFDRDVDEDDFMLEAAAKGGGESQGSSEPKGRDDGGADGKADGRAKAKRNKKSAWDFIRRGPLSFRAEIAVRNRRLSKL